MKKSSAALKSLIKLYPPVPGCLNSSHSAEPAQRVVGLCYHHADLRMRLVGGGHLDRSERLYLVHLEIASRVTSGNRRYRRHPVSLPAILHSWTESIACLVTDVGVGGLGITAARLPPHHGCVQVELPSCSWLPDASFSFSWRHVHGPEQRAGLRLVSVPKYVLPTPLGGARIHRRLPRDLPTQPRRRIKGTQPAEPLCTCAIGAVPLSTVADC